MHNLWRAEGREVLSFTKLFPRFFTFLPGIPGFCQVIPSFCDVWVKAYFWRKEKCDKNVFFVQKCYLYDQNGRFSRTFYMGCRGFDIAGISPPVGSVLWAYDSRAKTLTCNQTKCSELFPFFCIFVRF